MTNDTTFFTVGEMAALFDISRQTLLYYDKIGLLSPQYTLPNGYRCYTIQQYTDLEIIVNLRGLDFSIADIQHYMQNRGKAHLQALLDKKIKTCAAAMHTLEQTKRSAEHAQEILSVSYEKRLHRPLLTYHDERLYKPTPLTAAMTGKERVSLFAQHSHKTFHNKGVLEKRSGWIISTEAFFSDQPSFTSLAYFSYAPNVPRHPESQKHVMPAGLYTEYYFQGPFGMGIRRFIPEISRFLHINGLTPAGDIFVLPMENHWLTDQPQQYINQIFFPVQDK